MDVKLLSLLVLGLPVACMSSSSLYDTDGDGHVGQKMDCDPTDPDIFWEGEDAAADDARERDAGLNGKDDDCDGDTDEPFDVDQDRVYGEPNGDDCDDTNPDIHPGVQEVERNGKDDNCDEQGTRWDEEISLERSAGDEGLGLALSLDDSLSSSAFGAASAVLGDVGRDDGLDDLAIGAPATADGNGAICLRLTRLDPSGTSSSEITCPIEGQENQLVGRNVSSGYVDDGDPRLLVGVQGLQGTAHNVWLLEDLWAGAAAYTRVEMDPQETLEDAGVTGASVVDQSHTFVGDLSSDTVEEIFVGATGVLDGQAVAGLLYLGAQDTTRFRLLLSDDASGSVRAAARRGDVDGDGVGDLVLGLPSSVATASETPETDDGATDEEATDTGSAPTESALSQAGVTYLIRGDDLLNDADVSDTPIDIDDAALKIFGEDGWALGTSVESGRDLDGDGLDDLLLGAPNAKNDWEVAGGAVVCFVGISGGGEILAREGSVFFNPGSVVNAGTTAALPGDTDADGQQDALVGSGAPTDGEGAGEGPVAWLLLDPAAPGVHALSASDTITTFTASYGGAWRVAPAGDVDVAPGEGARASGAEFILSSSTGSNALLIWGRGM